MAEIETFQPEKRTLGQILSSTSPPIRVPDFQRDYSWAEQQVSEFWEDLVAFGGNEPISKLAGKEYFLGAAVLVNNGTYHLLLDGQQRLATATILLAVLRDKINEFKADAAKQIQDQYIAFEDHLTGEKVSKIQLNVFDRSFFRDYVQAFPRVDGTVASKKSHQLVEKAYGYFHTRVAAGWDAAGGGKKGFNWAAHITQILREHLALVTVVSNNEKSAASIFATLNDRGIGLSTVDLIRSFVLQHAHETQREEILQCWDGALDACGTAITAEALMRLSWVSQHGDIKARALYKVVSEHLDKGTSPLEYSRRLRDDAVLYRRFRDGDSDDEDLQESWTAPRTLKANSAYALLLSAHHKLTSDEQRQLAKALVSLAVRHNIVCNLDRARYETTVYAAAKRISEGHGYGAAIGDLRSISPDDELFVKNFCALTFSQSEHGTARYLLRGVEASLAATKELVVAGSSKVHVEHIYPQTPREGMALPNHKQWVNRIGNLTLLDRRLNETIKNAAFADKKLEAYSKSQLALTKALLSFPDDWTSELIDRRSFELCTEAQKVWPQTLV
ncbi:MAG: DUF262 domain-containing protein [Bryobacterales bacterium]|nr:DUF262 domain-containing protein [Bryobacterales bacterium]